MLRLSTILLSLHLLLVSLLPNNNIVELRKMGNLWLHFEHHLQVHQENISFLDFLLLHTFDEQHLQKDHAEHEDLPFHQHENHYLAKIFFDVPRLFTVKFALKPVIVPTQYVDNYHFILPNTTSEIWQPPKVS
jgi:hypothetical protein